MNLFDRIDIIQVKGISKRCRKPSEKEEGYMTKNDLEQLILKYGDDIYRFCYHLTGSRDDADDLYQDTMCKAYEVRKRIKNPEDDSLLNKERNYCLGIAVRLYKNSYRKKTISVRSRSRNPWTTKKRNSVRSLRRERKPRKSSGNGSLVRRSATVFSHYP